MHKENVVSTFNTNMTNIEIELQGIYTQIKQFEVDLPEIIATATVEALRDYLKIDKED